MNDPRPPVVLLHGWGGSSASTYRANGWLDILREAGRLVEAIDLPGHERSASHDPAHYADMADQISQRLPGGVLDLVGFSLGGKLALAMAGRRPTKFRRLVIGGVGDNVFAPEAYGEAVARAIENGTNADTPPAVAALVRYSQASGADPLALAAVLRRPPNPVLEAADLARITAEVLLVRGDRDAIATPDVRLRSALGEPAHIVLPECDHVCLPQQAGFVTAAVAFLNSRHYSDEATALPV